MSNAEVNISPLSFTDFTTVVNIQKTTHFIEKNRFM